MLIEILQLAAGSGLSAELRMLLIAAEAVVGATRRARLDDRLRDAAARSARVPGTTWRRRALAGPALDRGATDVRTLVEP